VEAEEVESGATGLEDNHVRGNEEGRLAA
jgi:hypothetical protein